MIIIQMTQISSLLYLDKWLGTDISAVCGSVASHVWIPNVGKLYIAKMTVSSIKSLLSK